MSEQQDEVVDVAAIRVLESSVGQTGSPSTTIVVGLPGEIESGQRIVQRTSPLSANKRRSLSG